MAYMTPELGIPDLESVLFRKNCQIQLTAHCYLLAPRRRAFCGEDEKYDN